MRLILLALLAVSVASRLMTPLPFRHRPVKTFLASKEYDISYFKTKVDHFSQDEPSYFKLKVLSKKEHFKPGNPILFYCGNESPIESFWNNSGFVHTTLAKHFGAYVVFAEHRYYGESLPFGPTDSDINKNKYLSVEQALMDFVDFFRELKKQEEFKDSKVIAFGGSYGGMLAAWARMKFPNIFDGALASSAPILLFKDKEIGYEFFRIVTRTYEKESSQCPSVIREAYKTLEHIKNAENKALYEELNEVFKPCKKISSKEDVKKLELVVDDAFVIFSQYNLPYPADGYSKLPAYPVKYACEQILKKKRHFPAEFDFSFRKYNHLTPTERNNLEILNEAVQIYMNFDKKAECIDIGNDEKIEHFIWEFQACTQMIFPIGKDGIKDMFSPSEYSEEENRKECTQFWKGRFDSDWPFKFYGGDDYENELKMYSNLMFANGTMDPWNSGCPHSSANPGIKVVEADAPHHMDLQLPRDNDYPSVVKMREEIIEEVSKWIGK